MDRFNLHVFKSVYLKRGVLSDFNKFNYDMNQKI